MTSAGEDALVARAEIRQIMARKGHAVDIARDVRERLRRAFREGALEETQALSLALADLELALAQAHGQKLGGKSGEASRFILRAIDRRLDEA